MARAPHCSAARANGTAVTTPSSKPLRTLTVTGIVTALTTASTTRGRRIDITQQCRATTLFRHFRHPATHVDVDDIGAVVGHDSRRLRHHLWLTAEELHRYRCLIARPVEPGRALCPIGCVLQRVTADEFGAHQTAAALLAYQSAHRSVGVPGHRRQKQRRPDRHIADHHRSGIF